MVEEEFKNYTSQQQRTTAATTFYGRDERGKGSSDAADFDLVSPGLLLKDSTADDDHLIDSQLLDDTLLDNLINEDGNLSTMYNTERLDSIKILSDDVFAEVDNLTKIKAQVQQSQSLEDIEIIKPALNDKKVADLMNN